MVHFPLTSWAMDNQGAGCTNLLQTWTNQGFATIYVTFHYCLFTDDLFKLTASDRAQEDEFGGAVAINESHVLVAAHQDDDSGEDSGSVYVFNAMTGLELRKLLPADGAAFDEFGKSVAISGQRAVVGAWRDDDLGDMSGSAYIFDVNTGQELLKLVASDGVSPAAFGRSVSVDEDRIVVGACYDTAAGYDSGAAYVFDATTGQQHFKLTPLDGDPYDNFGWSVSVSGPLAAIGSPQDDGNVVNSGSAFVFDVTTGQQLHKLVPLDGELQDRFGESVAISGDRAVVGADWDDDHGNRSGAAYVFDALSGQQLFKLLPSDGADNDHFGWSVSADEAIAVIGALRNDESGFESGSAYIFELISGQQVRKLLAYDGAPSDRFGHSVAISGNRIVSGAPLDDGIWTDSGSAYLCNGFQTLCTAVHPTSGHSYHLLEHSDWITAEATARALGGHLATINNQAEDDWLLANFGECPAGTDNELLIGFHDSNVEGSFEWTSGEPVSFTNWGPGEPNDYGGAEDYTHMRYATSGTGWNDFGGTGGPAFHGVVEISSPPGARYCFGTPGSGTPCPCNNDNDESVPESGCANGVYASGAQLNGCGTARLTDDTFVLYSSGLVPSNAGLYFQANNDRSPGVPWGDGLSCAGGGLKRLQVRIADTSGASFTTIAISAKAGNIVAGDTKYYQCWYRDPVASPCGFEFNASNGFAATWLP